MGLFSSIMGPQGLVGHHGLLEWWADLFTPQETAALERAYARGNVAAGRGQERLSLTRGVVRESAGQESAARFLAGLAPLVNQVVHEKEPAVWAEAERLALDSDDLLDLHAVYSGSIKAFYARREEDEDYLDAALSAAEELVEMAPEVATVYRKQHGRKDLPPHRGFKLLAVISEKQGDYDKALTLCRRAREQGWAGDWETQIARLEKKAAR